MSDSGDKISEIIQKLASSSSNSQVFNALVAIRTQHLRVEGKINREHLDDHHQLLDQLVNIMRKMEGGKQRSRNEVKILDVLLSILGNLMTIDNLRNRFRELKGIQILVDIMSSLDVEDESVLCRASRTASNLATDDKNATLMIQKGMTQILIKFLDNCKQSRTIQVVVKAFRFLGSNPDNKKSVRECLALRKISDILAMPTTENDEDLLKSITKCLAHYTHNGDTIMADQIQGSERKTFQVLSDLVSSHSNRSIWESAMACLVNLSYIDGLRPTLGNVGTISAIVNKLNDPEIQLSGKELAHVTTSLCLFCRESVNRMKIRQCNGLKLFGKILSDANLDNLHDRVINSLLQFAYDGSGLTVLQNEGIIPILLSFVDCFTKLHAVTHDCTLEICDKGSEVSVQNLNESEILEGGTATDLNDENQEHNSQDNEQHNTRRQSEETENLNNSENFQDNDVSINIQGQSLEANQEPIEEGEEQRFRVNSPSYQAVKDELKGLKRLYSMDLDLGIESNGSGPGSVIQSPDRSPFPWRSPAGYSPDYSHGMASPMSTDSGCTSPLLELSFSSDSGAKYQEEAPKSPMSSTAVEDDTECVDYSPVEYFSDEESSSKGGAGNRMMQSPPEKKQRRDTPKPSTSKSIFSPSHSPAMDASPINFPPALPKELPTMMPFKSVSLDLNKKLTDETSRINWILQILSRFSQMDQPHPDMSDLNTTKVLIEYLSSVDKPNPRAGRILLRLSKNIYCIMHIVEQRQLSWMKAFIDSRPTMEDSPCNTCNELISFWSRLIGNITSLGETGFAEGEMCHILNRGLKEKKQNVAVSASMLIKTRKLLINVMLSHDALEILFDILESVSPNTEEPESLFSDAVLGISSLSGHVGVVAPNLKLNDKHRGVCEHEQSSAGNDLKFKLDNGSEVSANKNVISASSQVFDAMLGGNFLESQQESIILPECSKEALVILIHYLYGCRWCKAFQNLSVKILLELVALSDRYLLNHLNKSLSHEIVQRCLKINEVVIIYEKSLQKEYAVWGINETLSQCTVNYLLVGIMKHEKRAKLFLELMKSRMKTDFIDDLSKIIKAKILDR